MKATKYFSLSNKYFFIFILVVLIGILSGINNYYFYAHVERSAARNLSQLTSQINSYYDSCKKNNIAISQCYNDIVLLTQAFSEGAYYNDTMTVKDNNNNFIWEKPTQEWDKVVKSDIEIYLPPNYSAEDLTIKKSITFNNYLVFISIIRSMTFSIVEFLEDINKKYYANSNGVFEVIKKDKKDNTYVRLDNKVFKFNKYYIFHKKNKDIVNKGELLVSGNIYVAMHNFLNIYWYRSRPALGFLVFSFLILYLYQKREFKILEEEEKKDQEIIENVRKTKIEEEDIYEKLKKYDAIINPPVNTLNAENLFTGDIDEIGTKFRKVAEKIVFQVYENSISERPPNLNLSSAIHELNKKSIISESAKNYLSIVRVYGNLSAHYTGEQMSKPEAIAVVSSLMKVIDEIVDKNLLNKSVQDS